MKKLNTGIFIFDGVEVLEFAGSFEVCSRTRLVPGVESRRSDQLLDDLNIRAWIQNAANKARLTTSVCTGALLLDGVSTSGVVVQ